MEACDVRSGTQPVAQPNSNEIDGDGDGFQQLLFELPTAAFQLVFNGEDDEDVMAEY